MSSPSRSLEVVPARILLVDDEPDILESLKVYLEGTLEVEVSTAESGQEGLDVLGRGAFDLAVSDFRMPVMDGLEFLTRARAVAPHVRRVMMTAFPDAGLAIRALNEAAIDRFVTKPLDPPALRDAIDGLLKARLAGEQRSCALERAADLRPRAQGA